MFLTHKNSSLPVILVPIIVLVEVCVEAYQDQVTRVEWRDLGH